MVWSPHAPALLGLDWPVTRSSGVRLHDPAVLAEATFTSSTTETIDAIVIRLIQVRDGAFTLHVVVDGETVASDAAEVVVDGEVRFSVGSWAKTDGDEVTLRVAKIAGPGEAVWPAVGGADAPLGASPHLPVAHAYVLVRSDGDPSVDSQPYHQVRREPVHAGRTVAQELTVAPSETGERAWVQVVAARHRATVGDLEIRVRKSSDDTQVGGVATISPDELADDYRTLRAVAANLAEPADLDNEQYYVECSADADPDAPWEISVLRRLEDPTGDNVLDDDTAWFDETLGAWEAEDFAMVTRQSSPAKGSPTGTHVMHLADDTPAGPGGGGLFSPSVAWTDSDSFEVTAGETYFVSGAVMVPVSVPVVLQLRWRVDETWRAWQWIAAEQGPSPNVWVRLSAELPAPAGADRVQLRAAYHHGEFGAPSIWDDFRVRLGVGDIPLGFGGTDDAAIVDGARDPLADLPLLLGETPEPVEDVTVEPLLFSLKVRWSATSLGAGFDAYVIRRGGQVVATIHDETVEGWVDLEVRNGRTETYTVQVRNTLGVTSIPSAPAAGVTSEGRWRIASNHAHLVIPLDVAPPVEHDLPLDRAWHRLYGRDGAATTVGDEQLGETITLHVELAASGPVEGRDLLDQILTARATNPYVTLTSPLDGRRWLGTFDVDPAALLHPSSELVDVTLVFREHLFTAPPAVAVPLATVDDPTVLVDDPVVVSH